MTENEKKHQLREHLALISTEAYLMLKASGEQERSERYNLLQEQIHAILRVIDEPKPEAYSCPDIFTP